MGLEWCRVGDDIAILVAAGNCIHTAQCYQNVPNLQLLCQNRIADLVPTAESVERTALPNFAQNKVLDMMKSDWSITQHFDLTSLVRILVLNFHNSFNTILPVGWYQPGAVSLFHSHSPQESSPLHCHSLL